MSTVAEPASLTRYVSSEECDELFDKAQEAFDRGDEETGYSYYAQIPLIPSLAKFVFKRKGREYCMNNFNLFEANAKFGEGWMDG